MPYVLKYDSNNMNNKNTKIGLMTKQDPTIQETAELPESSQS